MTPMMSMAMTPTIPNEADVEAQRPAPSYREELTETLNRAGHGFTIANLSSRLTEGGQQFEYRMTIKSRDRKAAEALSRHLRGLPDALEVSRRIVGVTGCG